MIKTEKEYYDFFELYNSESYDIFSHAVLGTVLKPFQTKAIALGLYLKRLLISLDTGLGKTYCGAGLINMCVEKGKWIYVCPSVSINQMHTTLESLLFAKTVISSKADRYSVITTLPQMFSADVIILSYEAICNPAINDYIFKMRNDMTGIILDESHTIANAGSYVNNIIESMLSNCFEYRYFLTATPLRVNAFQIINQIHMLDKELIPDPQQLTNSYSIYQDGVLVGYHDLDELSLILSSCYYSYTRADYSDLSGYDVYPIICQGPSNKDLNDVNVLKKIKSSIIYEPMQRLRKQVLDLVAKGKRGLIYANLSIYKDAIKSMLSPEIKIDIIDGTTNQKNLTTHIQEEFNKGNLDVVIFNIASLNLSCDFIIIYEQSFDLKQLMGRGIRGFEEKILPVYFYIIDQSYDIKYFYNNVYSRLVLLEELAGKDIKEIKVLKDRIERNIKI